jgi:hypothetical protein
MAAATAGLGVAQARCEQFAAAAAGRASWLCLSPAQEQACTHNLRLNGDLPMSVLPPIVLQNYC